MLKILRFVPISALILLLMLSIVLPAQDQEEWFPFVPEEMSRESEIDMSSWLDKPAGKYGSVLIEGDKFVFKNGKTIKFWGTNICDRRPFMINDESRKWAGFLARFGINGVRFHKFTWDATDGIHSTVITSDKWKNFDFLCNELRQQGIYYGWSHIYGHRICPADSSRLLAYTELVNTRFPWSHLNATTSALVNFAEDLQTLNIELTVNMLNHVNPYTGLRYADDPALSFVEFQNEDNIFWGAIEETLKQTPTYRKLLCRKFSDWLLKKYGSESALKQAWQNEGFAEDESLEEGNIYPQPNHGLFTWEYEQAIKENRKVKQHYLDKITFLFEEQQKFYKKFEMAVRETGYKGPLVGSCWQAGSGITHLLNLYADYEVGIIDRHNYFGGGSGHSLAPGKFDNSAMVSQIGSGLFGTGLQQVADRPFVLSEWMSLIPNEWTAESSPLIAIYGMGLQGWDGSYSFATDFPHYTNTIQTNWGGIYNVTSPTQLALYPALAAMIYRNDVVEGDVVVKRKVDLKTMLNGETAFRESVQQDYDRKSIEGAFPMNLMATGKTVLTFADENNVEVAVSPLNHSNDSLVQSVTGQLIWSEKGRGYFTINTSGTKGLVGFAKNQPFQLGEISLNTENEFAVVLITSLEKDKGTDNAKRLLVTTIARAQNSGMKFSEDRSVLLENGNSPIVLEPVKLILSSKRKGKAKVTVLDHSGKETETTYLSNNGQFIFDGEHSKAIYYLIEYH